MAPKASNNGKSTSFVLCRDPEAHTGRATASSSRPARTAAPKSFADESAADDGDAFDFGEDDVAYTSSSSPSAQCTYKLIVTIQHSGLT